MDPLETLSNEHGLIRHFLGTLSAAAKRIEDGRRPPADFFRRALEFDRTFVDKYHHFKEERVLFVQLARKSREDIDTELSALEYQHERGRDLMRSIEDALDGYVEKKPNQTTDLLETISAYVALMRHHVHTEDHVFYPMARKTLGESEMEEVAAEFDRERARYGLDTFERCHKIVVDMGSILTHLR